MTTSDALLRKADATRRAHLALAAAEKNANDLNARLHGLTQRQLRDLLHEIVERLGPAADDGGESGDTDSGMYGLG